MTVIYLIILDPFLLMEIATENAFHSCLESIISGNWFGVSLELSYLFLAYLLILVIYNDNMFWNLIP